MLRGANVTLVTGKTDIKPPAFVNVVNIISAQDMYEAVVSESRKQDIIIKAAAVADYRQVRWQTIRLRKVTGICVLSLQGQRISLDIWENKEKKRDFIPSSYADFLWKPRILSRIPV